MSDMLELLQTRRSVAALNLVEPGPNEDTLRTLLTIAARVPDHGKLAPWRFIIFRGDGAAKAGEKLAEIAAARGETDVEKLAQERTRMTRAPLVVAVVSCAAPHPKIPVWEQELSAGAVCMNLLVATHASGFAGQWVTEWYCFDDEASALLGLKPGERFAGFVHIGTPTEVPSDRKRPDLDDLVTVWAEG